MRKPIVVGVLEQHGRIVVAVLAQGQGVIAPDQVYVPGTVTVSSEKGEKGHRRMLHICSVQQLVVSPP